MGEKKKNKKKKKSDKPMRVLKLSSKSGKIDIALKVVNLKTGEILKYIEAKESRAILKKFLEKWVQNLRKSFLLTLRTIDLGETSNDIEKFSEKWREIKIDNISNIWNKLFPEMYIDIGDYKIPIYKDNIGATIRFQLKDKLKRHLKEEFKTFAIKNVPYIRRIKRQDYVKNFNDVIRNINLSYTTKNEKNYLEISMLLDLFTGINRNTKLLLEVNFQIKLKNRDFNKAVESSYRNILERIKSGEYRVAFVGLNYKRTEGFSILIAYEVPPKKVEKPQNIMGVDLGQKVLAYVVVIPPKLAKEKFISSERELKFYQALNAPVDLEALIKKIWYVKSKLLSEYRKAKEQEKLGLKSPTKTRLRKDLKAIRHKEKNLMKKINEHIANEIIRIAVKNNVKVIHLENLSGIKKQKLKFPKWNYGQLQNFIAFKADEFNIKVKKVNPRNTSIRCPKCGHIDKDNRPKQAEFKCTKCGYEPDVKAKADFVGALNIAFDINQSDKNS